MSFSEFYTEAKTDLSAPVKVEQVFVDVINKGKTTKKFERYESTAKQIIEHLNLKGQATHIGSDMDGKLNDFYLKTVKGLGMPDKDINKRPKTDMIINTDRVSLKLDRGWIFSHLLIDSEACLKFILQSSDTLKASFKKEIISTFEELKALQSKDLHKTSDSKVLKNALVDKFKTLFEKQNGYIKTLFIQAGLRGTFKFDESDKATADKIMVVKYKNKNIKTQTAMTNIQYINLEKTNIYDLKKDYAYLKKIAETSRVAFVIRESGKLRFDINSIQIDGVVLTEGIIDTIVNLLKQGYENVKTQIDKILKYLIDLINKGVAYLMDVLGLSVDVQMNNEIEF